MQKRETLGLFTFLFLNLLLLGIESGAGKDGSGGDPYL